MAWSQCMTTIPRGLLNVKLIEPPCTERYARWCERSANQLMISLLLDRRGTFPEGWFAGMHLVGAMHLQWRCIRIGKILLAGMHLLGRNHPCGRKKQAGDESGRKKSSLWRIIPEREISSARDEISRRESSLREKFHQQG